jgi:hypothetical protein
MSEILQIAPLAHWERGRGEGMEKLHKQDKMFPAFS